ncbi:MAG: leucyl aminopeptidase [Pseudomonadota bacterium]
MNIAFVPPNLPTTGAVAVGVLEECKLTPVGEELDKKLDGALTRAMSKSRFKGKKRETMAVIAPAGVELSRVILIGMGKAEDFDATLAQAMGGELIAQLNSAGEVDAALIVETPQGSIITQNELAANLAFGARLRAYRFDRYRTKEKEEQKPTLKTVSIMTSDPSAAEREFKPLDGISTGVFFTRDLVSEPANILFPESYAKRCEELSSLGVDVEVLGEAEMQKLGMGALLGVGQGSVRDSQLVIMRWNGHPDKNEPPVAFIGKGVCFDTGGISIKPAGGMEDMKWDMAGAGAVCGAMKALAARSAKANVVGIVGLVENMPDGNAQRPGDVVTSMSGQTIEVLNTDAEGRLVLADAMWYCQDRFKPRLMVDLATLTGAIIVALGHEYAGVFSNSDELSDRLTAAGKSVGEGLWRMPLADSYDKDIDCDVADMKNIGGGRAAGSITAAQFLQRFANKVDWAHLDIAGVAWSKKDKPTIPKGATAFGVRLLDTFISENYEAK